MPDTILNLDRSIPATDTASIASVAAGMESVFRDAVEAAAKRLGNHAKVAAELGCSRQNLSSLLARGRPCPPERVPALARVSGYTRKQIRPDIYGEAA